MSARQQCELLELSRSNYYYEPAQADPADVELMNRIDRLYAQTPFYGSRKLAVELSTPDAPVNRKWVQRLMRVMGLETLYCRPETTVTGRDHKVYPYLLRNVPITRPNQVWSADIPYVPMPSGFLYLTATIDWFSRFVVAWKLSGTLDGAFCQEMLDESLSRDTPEEFNTDQGVQFTARVWTSRLEGAGVAVSMHGKGRCLDDIFVERLWRSLKYEYAYPCAPRRCWSWSAGYGSTSGSTTTDGFISPSTTGHPPRCIGWKTEDSWRGKKRERKLKGRTHFAVGPILD